jgi:hypothetical protein
MPDALREAAELVIAAAGRGYHDDFDRPLGFPRGLSRAGRPEQECTYRQEGCDDAHDSLKGSRESDELIAARSDIRASRKKSSIHFGADIRQVPALIAQRILARKAYGSHVPLKVNWGGCMSRQEKNCEISVFAPRRPRFARILLRNSMLACSRRWSVSFHGEYRQWVRPVFAHIP